ncbi:TonB-dependent receptor plug [Fibrisoma limi BUZ 3]|uniref:TonB-dependent receptor plug n=1 Tax=Fibrisoma limi BUZ 3 TaxID=1185876 RepID=I2GIJ1_9BACT|nr:TonB-dependent receptor [Fibrisoma limi]CCH53716.1 TonB-dependent receptor plug [Fibrisoma limi BUZ 3]
MKICLLFFLLLSSAAQAQSYLTVTGQVSDAASGVGLAGATITVLERAGSGARTDSDGRFALSVAAGKQTLRISYLGYVAQRITVNLSRNEVINVRLKAADNQLSEVVVTGQSNQDKVMSTQTSVDVVDRKTALSLPVVFGEVDLIKVLQLKPGVKSTGEGTSGISVRGGSTDQNLFQYDGTTVYNPSHMFGFFSTFNIDAVKNVALYKAGFPAEYSGRLSSVVDVTSLTPRDSSFHVGGGIGLIASRLNLTGPIGNKIKFNVAGRRTYADVFTEAINRRNGDRPNTNPIPRYYFYDLNGRIDYTINDRSRLFLSAYTGRDRFHLPSDVFRSTFDWGNTAVSLHWHQTSKDARWNSHTSGHYAQYDYRLVSTFDRFTFNIGSGIEDFVLKERVSWQPNPRHTVTFGGELTRSRFSISRVNISSAKPEENIDTGEKPRVWEGGLFVSDDWDVTPKLKLSAGLRWSGFRQDSAGYNAPEPRISARYAFSPSVSLKASYARMVQYRHLVVSSGAALPTDIWYPSTAKIKPEYSDQLAAALTWNIGNTFLLTNEVYYKRLRQVVDFRTGAQLFANDRLENEFVFGNGSAYGNEIYLEKTAGRLRGWVGYTLAWTWREFKDIDGGKRFFPRYDRRHDISVVAMYQLRPRLTLSATWVYNTGNAVSLATGRYVSMDNPYVRVENPTDQVVPEFPSRNNFRMPSYHRLDLGFVYKFRPRRGETDITVNVTNAYNRLNPYLITYQAEENAEGEPTGRFRARAITLFPLLPSVTYNFRF